MGYTPRKLKHTYRRAVSAFLAMLIVFTYSAAGVLTAQALPTGWNVVEGNVSVDITGDIMTITSTTDTAIISYISFDLANGETINFIMPGASSSIINQVIGGNISNIAGTINANGIIGLQNTAGIQIANSAQINAAALLATTLNIGNFDGNSIGLMKDAGQDGAAIVNEGDINVSKYAILAGSGIANMGSIIAEDGTIHLAVGDSMTFHLSDNQSISVTIDDGIQDTIDGLNATITNSGTMEAHQVELKAKLADQVIAQAINNDGVIEATQLNNNGGTIVIEAIGGTHTVMNSGTLMATGNANQSGGAIHVLGQNITHQGATLDVSGGTGGGNILIGGDYQGKGSVQNALNTTIDENTAIKANATSAGDGGRIIVWADESTVFKGDISATGGAVSGDGGFAEVSGKQDLLFSNLASANLTATNGSTGTLLLDPTNIDIYNGAGTDTASVFYEQNLETLSLSSNIVLMADDNIRMRNLADNVLGLGANDITLTTTNLDIYFDDVNDTIRTEGGNINITAGDDIRVGRLNTTGAASNVAGGVIDVRANHDLQIRGMNAIAGITAIADNNSNNVGEFRLYAGDDINTGGSALNVQGELVRFYDDVSTSGGSITVLGDRAGDGTGFIDYAATGTDISSGGGTITMTADRILMDSATSTLSSGGGDINLIDDGVNDNEDIRLNSDFALSGRNLTVTTAQDFEMYGTSSVNMTGTVLVNADDDILANGSTVGIQAAGNVILNADDALNSGDVTSTAGTITLSADHDANGVGNATIYTTTDLDASGNDITIYGQTITLSNTAMTTNGGNMYLYGNRAGVGAGVVDFGTNAFITTGNANLTIQSDQMHLDGGASSGINVGTGTLTLTDNGAIDNNDILINGGFAITGRNLVANSNHDINLAGNSTINMTGTINMNALDEITAQGGDMTATGDINLTAGDHNYVRQVVTTTGNINIIADNNNDDVGNFTIYDGNDVDTNGGNLTVRAENIIIADDVYTDGGNIILEADKNNNGVGYVNFDTDARLFTTNGDATLSGDRLLLDGGALSGIFTGTGNVILTDDGSTDNEDIQLNTGFTITGQQITATSNHGLNIYNNSSLNSNTTISLTAATDLNASSGDMTAVGNIDVFSGNHLYVRGVTTTTGDIQLVADNNNSNVGNFRIYAGTNLNTNGGDLTVRGENVILDDNIASAGGNVTLEADKNGNGSGYVQFLNNSQINTANGHVNLSGDRLLLYGGATSAINAGTGNVTLTDDGATDNEDVYLANGFTITGNQLIVNSNHDFEVRDLSTVNMTGNVTATASDDVLANTGIIGSTGGNVQLNANDLVYVAEVTTGGGSITLSSDHDNNGVGNFILYDGNNIDSNGGALSILAENITIYDDIDTDGGVITLTANRNNAGNGTFNIEDNINIVSGNADINIRGADIALDGVGGDVGGSINSGTADITITENGVTDSTDVSINRGFGLIGRNITIDSNHDIELHNSATITASGTVDLDAVDDIYSTSGTITSAGNMTADADDYIQLENVSVTGLNNTVLMTANNDVRVDNVTTNSGDITLRADKDANGAGNFRLYVGNVIDTNGGNLRLEGEYVQLDDNAFADGGDINFIANRDNAGNGTLTLNSSSIDSANGDITLQGADMYFNGTGGNTMSAGTGDITLIENGSVDTTDLYFTNGYTVTGRNLTATSNHDIEVRLGSLINMTGTVNMTAADDIFAQDGDIRAAGNIDLFAGDHLYTREVTTTAGNIQLVADNNNDNVGNLSFYAGNNINTNGGNLTGRGELVIIQDDIISNGGNVTLEGDKAGDGTGYVDFYNDASITTAGGNVHLSGDRLLLDGSGTSGISAGAGNVTLIDDGATNNEDISLNNTFTITGNNLTATSNHDFEMYNDASVNMTGTVLVNADLDVAANSGDITAVGNITLNGDDDVRVRGVASTNGNVTLSADTDASGVGSFIQYAGTNIAVTGAGRTLSILGENITLYDDLSTNGGVMTFTANRNNAGAGTFNVESNLNITSNNANINISGADVLLDGAGALTGGGVNSGTGDISVISNNPADGNDILLNRGYGLTGRNLTMNSTFDVTGYNDSTINMTGTVDITAADDIDFNGLDIVGASAITLNSGDHMNFRDITSTGGGNITLNADSDSNDVGNINFAAGDNVITNGGDLIARGETITLSENLNTLGGDVTLNGNRNSGGGNGVMDFANNAFINSGNGNVLITGESMHLDGGLASGIASGTGDITLTDNGNINGNDIYIHQGFTMTGRNLTATTNHDINMYNSNDTITMTGDVIMDAGSTIALRNVIAGGNIGIEADSNIRVYNNGLTANGSTGLNGAADETLAVVSKAGNIIGDNFITTGAGNTRIQAGTFDSITPTSYINVNNVQASGNAAFYTTYSGTGNGIVVDSNSSVAGHITAAGLNASNFWQGVNGGVVLDMASGNANTALVWTNNGGDINVTARNGSITQDLSYGAYVNGKTLRANGANADVNLRAYGGAGSYISTGVMALGAGSDVLAEAFGQSGGGTSVQLFGRSDGNTTVRRYGGGGTDGDVFLGTNIGDPLDLNDVYTVYDTWGNANINSLGAVQIHGSVLGNTTITATRFTGRYDKENLNVSNITTTGAGGVGIDAQVLRGRITGNNMSTAGGANMILQAGSQFPRDKMSYITVTNVNTSGNLSIKVAGSTTGDGSGNSVVITGSTGGGTTVTNESGGAAIGTVTTP